MSDKIYINNCNIERSQIGEKNIMNFENSLTEEDWDKLGMFFNDKLETLQKDTIYYFLTEEAKDYVKQRNQKGFKEFIHRHASEFAIGIFCNMASAGIIGILRNFGIQI